MPYVPGWLKRSPSIQSKIEKYGPYCFHALNLSILLCTIGVFVLCCICMYNAHTIASVMCCAASGITCLVTIFGAMGVVRRIPLLIWVYAAFMVFLIVYNLAAIAFIASGVENERIKNTIKKNLQNRLNWYAEDLSKKKRMDRTQQFHKCCGVDGPGDFVDNIDFEYMPDSCCPPHLKEDCGYLEAYTKSCKTAIYNYMHLLSIIAICVAGVQVLIMICVTIVALCYWWVLNHRIDEESKKTSKNPITLFFSKSK